MGAGSTPSGIEPLQRRSARRGRVADANARCMRREIDAQPRSEDRIPRLEPVAERAPVEGKDSRNLEIAGVEIQRAFALQRESERRLPAQDPGWNIYAHAQRDPPGPPLP